MFVIETDESGKMILRPAFVRYIKNDYVRRTLIVIYTPFIIVLTFLFIVTVTNIWCVLSFIRSLLQISKLFSTCWMMCMINI